jgi:hypothetical protein
MTTAENILNYGPADVGKIFKGDAKSIKSEFRKLATKWHPDHCNDPKAAEVFQRIMELRDIALSRGSSKLRETKITFTKPDRKTFKANVLRTTLSDTGKVHIGRHSISYEYDGGLSDIAEAERTRIEGFRFADRKMKEQMSHGLPVLVAHAELEGQAALNIIERPAGEVLLSDFLDTFGEMPAVHAAWLGSGLFNIACYLEWAGIVHGAIGMDTVLVQPETHSVRLVGGWGFSTPTGKRPVMLPNRTLETVPTMAVKGQVATAGLDLELIRQTLREVLGDASGMRLKASGTPEPLVTFLQMPPAKTAMQDYSAWHQSLLDAWGQRRFIKFNGTANQVYP